MGQGDRVRRQIEAVVVRLEDLELRRQVAEQIVVAARGRERHLAIPPLRPAPPGHAAGGLRQQLCAEADAEDRQPLLQRLAQHVARRVDRIRRVVGVRDARQRDHGAMPGEADLAVAGELDVQLVRRQWRREEPQPLVRVVLDDENAHAPTPFHPGRARANSGYDRESSALFLNGPGSI